MQTEKITSGNEQYTLWQIFFVWLAAGVPMWLLALGSLHIFLHQRNLAKSA